jgi:hypothetical protein
MNTSRRTFLKRSTVGWGALAAFPLFASVPEISALVPADDPERPRQRLDRVQTFVRAAHTDLPKVKEMLAQEPALLHASWDWGNGDWENALEAASHKANHAMADFLLEQGARLNPFCLAMQGEFDAIAVLIRAQPSLCNGMGPHRLTLLFHAALTSRVDLVQLIAAHIDGDKAPHFNQALLGAARNGSAEVVAWLVTNGVTAINETNFFNETPLSIALARGDEAIVEVLRRHGAALPSP